MEYVPIYQRIVQLNIMVGYF